MDTILTHHRFAETLRQLANVRLNPRRHTAPNALDHSAAVAAHAVALADANGCTEQQRRLLEDLGWAHDIGKVTGSARPERSLEVLRDYGVDAPDLLALVKWHDTSLPWYLASARGQAPSDKAWRRLAAEVDLRLLAMFMIADRVDAPAGWRRNAPTTWFLEEAHRRNLIGDLALDLPGHPSEVSAGGAVVREHEGLPQVLVTRVRSQGYELPKGGIEWDELPSEAAERETREEAGVASALQAGPDLGHVDYLVGEGANQHLKRVRYFTLVPSAPVQLDRCPERTRERRWVRLEEVGELPLVNEALRPVLLAALDPAQKQMTNRDSQSPCAHLRG